MFLPKRGYHMRKNTLCLNTKVQQEHMDTNPLPTKDREKLCQTTKESQRSVKICKRQNDRKQRSWNHQAGEKNLEDGKIFERLTENEF